MRKRKWTEAQLKAALESSSSIRQILFKLGLKQAGGNYYQIKKFLKTYGWDLSKLKGRGWNKGIKVPFKPKIPLEAILTKNNTFQSYKLKVRLLKTGLKKESCEFCGWAQKSVDGRIPLELDHINGDHSDNRIENLRILCPNCHSLQTTHRGRNTMKR